MIEVSNVSARLHRLSARAGLVFDACTIVAGFVVLGAGRALEVAVEGAARELRARIERSR